MQQYVTPHPGRTPADNYIVDREDYKLSITLIEFRPGEFQLCLDKFIQESGWHNTQYFVTQTELNKIRSIIGAKQ